jgi:hypothetical protein
MSAHVGHLPDTFDKFPRELGVPTRPVKSTTTYVEQAMKAHTVKMFKMFWKAARDGCDHPDEPEEHEDKDNESEMSEDVDNPTIPRQQLAWMARSDTDSSETDDTTSDESEFESDEEDDGDDIPPEPTRGKILLQIAKEAEEVDRLEESGQEQAWMTQSGTDSPMTDDDTASSESDSESDREDEDDSLTKQTRGERLLQVTKEAIEAEESENDNRTRVETPRPLSSAPT